MTLRKEGVSYKQRGQRERERERERGGEREGGGGVETSDKENPVARSERIISVNWIF